MNSVINANKSWLLNQLFVPNNSYFGQTGQTVSRLTISLQTPVPTSNLGSIVVSLGLITGPIKLGNSLYEPIRDWWLEVLLYGFACCTRS